MCLYTRQDKVNVLVLAVSVSVDIQSAARFKLIISFPRILRSSTKRGARSREREKLLKVKLSVTSERVRAGTRRRTRRDCEIKCEMRPKRNYELRIGAGATRPALKFKQAGRHLDRDSWARIGVARMTVWPHRDRKHEQA